MAVNPADGKELKTWEINQPLGPGARIENGKLVATGADGVIYIISLASSS